MNARYLKDLAEKTHRGLRVELRKSADVALRIELKDSLVRC